MKKNVLVKKLISTSNTTKSEKNPGNLSGSTSPKKTKLGESTPKVSNSAVKKNVLLKSSTLTGKKSVTNAPVIKSKNKASNDNVITQDNGKNKNSSSVIPDISKSAHKRTKTITGVNMVHIQPDYRQSFVGVSSTNYLRTEPFTSKNLQSDIMKNPFATITPTNSETSYNQLQSHIREDKVVSCLTTSLNILDKIQKDFENSAKNNVGNIDLNRQNIKDSNFIKLISVQGLTSDVISTIPNKELADLSLSVNKINSKFCCLQAVHISDTEKRLVSQNIAENSESRMKNYSNLFKIINITLEDIKVNIKELNEANRRNAEMFEMKEKLLKRYSFISPEVRDIKHNFGFCESNHTESNNTLETQSKEEETDNLRENIYFPIQTLPEESCNFSEATMLEHAIIAPPKIENKRSIVNIKTQDLQAIQIAPKEKLRNDTINEEYLDDTQKLEDNTIIEYDSLLTEEINFKKEADNPNFFIQAKDHIGYEKKRSLFAADVPYKSTMKNSLIHTNISHHTTAHSTEHTNYPTWSNGNNKNFLTSLPKYESTSNSVNIEQKKDKCSIF